MLRGESRDQILKERKAVVLDYAALFVILQTAALHSKKTSKVSLRERHQEEVVAGRKDVVKGLQLSADSGNIFRSQVPKEVNLT